MKKTPTYSEAYRQLEQLVAQLERGDIQLEQLADNVKQANALIAICENKLREIEADIDKATKTAKTKSKKKTDD